MLFRVFDRRPDGRIGRESIVGTFTLLELVIVAIERKCTIEYVPTVETSPETYLVTCPDGISHLCLSQK